MKVKNLFTITFVLLGMAIAQNSGDLSARMLQLQREIDVLTKEKTAEVQISTALHEQHQVRMQGLKAEVDRITHATDSMTLERTRLMQEKQQSEGRIQREKSRYERQQQALLQVCDSVLATLQHYNNMTGSIAAVNLLRERLLRSDVSLQEGWASLWNVMLQSLEPGFKWELQNQRITIKEEPIDGYVLGVGQALSFFIPQSEGLYYRYASKDWIAAESPETLRKHLEHMMGVLQGRLAPDLTILPLRLQTGSAK